MTKTFTLLGQGNLAVFPASVLNQTYLVPLVDVMFSSLQNGWQSCLAHTVYTGQVLMKIIYIPYSILIYHQDSKICEVIALASNDSILTVMRVTTFCCPVLGVKIPRDTLL